MIAYQEETFDQVIEEIKPLLEDHWQEIALHKDSIKLNPDYARYEQMFKNGNMRIVTARNDGKLVGYCIMMLYNHIHYKDQFMAMDDIFFIDKDYRNGLTGVKLFIIIYVIYKFFKFYRFDIKLNGSSVLYKVITKVGRFCIKL